MVAVGLGVKWAGLEEGPVFGRRGQGVQCEGHA